MQNLLQRITGNHALQAKLLYGAGLRLLECIRLRIQDVDFGQNLIYIRGGKGGKDRVGKLPSNIRDKLSFQIQKATVLHHRDLEKFTCTMPFRVNTWVRPGKPAGNTFSQQKIGLLIPVRTV